MVGSYTDSLLSIFKAKNYLGSERSSKKESEGKGDNKGGGRPTQLLSTSCIKYPMILEFGSDEYIF